MAETSPASRAAPLISPRIKNHPKHWLWPWMLAVPCKACRAKAGERCWDRGPINHTIHLIRREEADLHAWKKL